MITLGIDPGTATVGFSFVTGTRQNPQILEYGVLHTHSAPKEYMPDRLLELGQDLESLIQKYKPSVGVIEDLFFFKNQKTVISVAQSRGMMLYIMKKNGLQTTDVTPLQVKQTLCGYGRATKEQVQKVVKKIYNLDQIPKPDDAADSLAIAWFGLK
ncbi:MAG: crossover junction endodeoxyribonuclease RuvC [Thermales bacterium]|nr:crossover junction endodeoxyribonuclease RuvC [Thermales bacterium]